MKPQKTEELIIKELNEALELAQKVDRKIQNFNDISAQVAEKWQKKVEDRVKKINN